MTYNATPLSSGYPRTVATSLRECEWLVDHLYRQGQGDPFAPCTATENGISLTRLSRNLKPVPTTFLTPTLGHPAMDGGRGRRRLEPLNDLDATGCLIRCRR
jgi:hypothetical protein